MMVIMMIMMSLKGREGSPGETNVSERERRKEWLENRDAANYKRASDMMLMMIIVMLANIMNINEHE